MSVFMGFRSCALTSLSGLLFSAALRPSNPKKIENESQEISMNQEILHVEELESRLEMETAASESDGSCGIKCTCTIEL